MGLRNRAGRLQKKTSDTIEEEEYERTGSSSFSSFDGMFPSEDNINLNNAEEPDVVELKEAVTPDGQRRFELPETNDPYDLLLTLNPLKYTLESRAVLYCYLFSFLVAMFVESPYGIVMVTVFWRLVYNLGIGTLLYHQSRSLRITKWVKELQRNPFSPTYQHCRTVITSALGHNTIQQRSLPADYYAWILTRNAVAMVESNDVLAFTLTAIVFGTHIRFYGLDEVTYTFKNADVNPYSEGVVNYFVDFLGVLMVFLGLWGKYSAGRKAGEYAWYWADFFFIQTRSSSLRFDGIFELFPHPMYTVGYCWIYGCALLARSQTVLLLALFIHLCQLAFLWIVEHPHVDKLYGSHEPEASAEYKVANICLFVNFDPFRASDVNLSFILFFLFCAMEVGAKDGGPLDDDLIIIGIFIFWRVLDFLLLSYILLHQESSKLWTNHFSLRGQSSKEAFQSWMVLQNTLNTLKNFTFVMCAKRLAFFPSWEDVDVMYIVQMCCGVFLVGTSLWATRYCYHVLGDYGWFYGDFFLSPLKLRYRGKKAKQYTPEEEPFPTYTGIYRYLNNPDTYIGHLWVFGFSLLCSSQQLFGVAFISYVIRIAFLNIVEKPHVRAMYKHRVRKSSSAIGRSIRERASRVSNSDSVLFLSNWIKHPIETGALAPSSKQLAIQMCETMDIRPGAVVVELGPGTGPFTEEVLRRMEGKGTYIGFELSSDFMKLLRERFPDNKDDFVCKSAEHIREVLHSRGLEQADCVISGLPWAIFSKELQKTILEEVVAVLRPGGRFATFAYLQGVVLPAGQRFRALLASVFGNVERSKIVWKNLPPAFVYRCTVQTKTK